MPMFPLARTVKSDSPDEEATLNGLSGVEDELCRLNENVEEVAFTPATVPLSSNTPVASVEGDPQIAAFP